MLKEFDSAKMPVVLPQLLYSGTWAGGHNVLTTAPLQLTPVKRDARFVHLAANALASQNTVTRSALINSAYWQNIVEFVGEHDDSEVLPSTVAELERIWGASEFDSGMRHGDWTHANVGLQTTDFKFGPALKEGLRQWAR